MPSRLQKFILSLIILSVVTACTPSGIYHKVEPGQTLYRISKAYEIDENRLARINRIDDPTKLKAGQKLFIPGVTKPRRVPATSSTSVRSSSPPAKSHSVTRPVVTKTSKPAPKKTASPPRTSKKASPKKGLFDWPVKGKVVTGFGSKGDTAYKGIEIACKEGTTVKAAAPGKVIYSGSAIRGYGNLIIIEHSDSYFTVYGFNKKNLVTMDGFVGKGDKIALSGTPPNGKSPRLHFEIRHGKSAVDPIFYLP